MQPAPPPRPLPPFALWMTVRGLTTRQAGDVLKVSHETIRLICLPFDDEERRVPNKDLMRRIYTWTQGEIRPRDFYPYDREEATTAEVAA